MLQRDINGLTASQKLILAVLYNREVRNIQDFGRTIGLKTYAQISKIIKELEELKLVTKKKESIHIIVKITKKGREIIGEILNG